MTPADLLSPVALFRQLLKDLVNRELHIMDLQQLVAILSPLVSEGAALLSNVVSGARSVAVAKAELANILLIASQRLDAADITFAERDKAEGDRVKAEETKP